MAQTVTSPIVLTDPIRSGEALDDDTLLAAYTAAQCGYEEIIGALVIDPIAYEEWSGTVETGWKMEYRLPAPRMEGSTTKIVVFVCYEKGVGTNPTIEVNGEEYELDSTTPDWYSAGIEHDVSDSDWFDLTIEVTDAASGLRIFSVYAIATRARTEIPEGDLDNGVHGVDLDRIDSDLPCSVQRHNDALSLIRATHAQQYRSAVACADWQRASTTGLFAGSDAVRIDGGIEVPDSSSARTATLTVWAMAGDELGNLDVWVDGELKRIDCDVALTWYSETWTVAIPRAGISRPYRVPFSVQASVDVPIVSLCAAWSEVDP